MYEHGVFCLSRKLLLASSVVASSELLEFNNDALAQTDACAKGYVWREAFARDHVCVAPETHDSVEDENRNAEKNKNDGRDECGPGYVWRMAGPEDHVCVTQLARDQAQQDNSLANTRVTSAVQTGKPELMIPGARANVRSPPRKAGCYRYVDGEWQETPCLSEEFVRRNFPPPAPQYSIASNPRLFFGRATEFQYAMPIRFGSAEISHLSDPAEATLTDSLKGKDAFSIQVNTNFFGANNGSTGWVQFVLQSRPYLDDGTRNSDDALCVWQVDVLLARKTANTRGYTSTCTKVPKERFVWGPEDPYPAGARQTTFVGPGADIAEKSEVAGLLDDTQPGGGALLTAWAYVPWSPFSAYAITVNDQLGLRGRWTQVSGDILGIGTGSEANFTRTKLRTILQASPCIFDQCPDVQRLNTFPKYATSAVQLVTAESNNLSSNYDFAEHTPLFSCLQESCTLDYSTGPLFWLRKYVQNPLKP